MNMWACANIYSKLVDSDCIRYCFILKNANTKKLSSKLDNKTTIVANSVKPMCNRKTVWNVFQETDVFNFLESYINQKNN